MKKSIHIAVLHMGTIRAELSAVINVILLERRCGFNVSIRYYGDDYFSRPISSSRNRIIRDMPDADFCLQLDSDVVPPVNVLEIANYDCDIVACPSPVWRPGSEGGPVITGIVPLVPTTEPIQVGEDRLLECRRMGGGAYCIAKRVFTHPQMRGAFAEGFDEDGVTVTTEDYTYCDKARALGFRVFAALGFPLGHVKPINLVTVHDAVSRARE